MLIPKPQQTIYQSRLCEHLNSCEPNQYHIDKPNLKKKTKKNKKKCYQTKSCHACEHFPNHSRSNGNFHLTREFYILYNFLQTFQN